MSAYVPASRAGTVAPTEIRVNVYDLSPYNDALIAFGLGAFHSGVEVGGVEWTYGQGATSATGVFSHDPRAVPNARFRTSVLVGTVRATRREIESVVESMKPQWPGRGYHIYKQNCNSFSEALVQRLCGGHLPGYVNRLAYLGKLFSCLIPDSMFQGAAGPSASGSGGGGRGQGEGEDEDEGGRGGSSGAGSVFRQGRRSTNTSAASTAPAGAGQRLGGGNVATLGSSGAGGGSSGHALSNGNGTSFWSRAGAGGGAAGEGGSVSGASAGAGSVPSVPQRRNAVGSTASPGGATTAASRELMLAAAMRRAGGAQAEGTARKSGADAEAEDANLLG